MRSYGQYWFDRQHALDVVGDFADAPDHPPPLGGGACRYTDLKDGLPGIATNLLADRLRDLESGFYLIRREEVPPPVATTLFHLTDAGCASLLPVIEAIARWGIELMVTPASRAISSKATGSPSPRRCSWRTANRTAPRSRSSCAPTAAPP